MKAVFTSIAVLLIGSVIGSFFGYRFHERYVADGGEGANMKTLLIIVGIAAMALFTFRAVESLGGLMLAQPQHNRKHASMQHLIAVLAPPIYFLWEEEVGQPRHRVPFTRVRGAIRPCWIQPHWNYPVGIVFYRCPLGPAEGDGRHGQARGSASHKRLEALICPTNGLSQ